jgi:hypothetical protein
MNRGVGIEKQGDQRKVVFAGFILETAGKLGGRGGGGSNPSPPHEHALAGRIRNTFCIGLLFHHESGYHYLNILKLVLCHMV